MRARVTKSDGYVLHIVQWVLGVDDVLPLPEPDHNNDVISLEIGGAQIKLDKLGPVVIQSDGLCHGYDLLSLCLNLFTGTMTQIANWDQMTPDEQQLTLRKISQRNAQRKENLLRQHPTDSTTEHRPKL